MSKKFTYEEIKNKIEIKKGYKLLSEQYISTTAPLKIGCPKGHIFHNSYRCFKNDTGCPICKGMELRYLMRTDREKAYKYVKNRIKSEPGYELLSKEYIGNKSKLVILCSKGHIFKMRFNDFHNGRRCRRCTKGVLFDLRHKDIHEAYKYIKKNIESRLGYQLLSKEYIDQKSKLVIQCPIGHKFKMTYSDFKQGERCQRCSQGELWYLTSQGKKEEAYTLIKNEIESEPGYKLLSKKYVNNRTELKIQCTEGHIFKKRYDMFQKGQRCQKCTELYQWDEYRARIYKSIKREVESIDYKLLSKHYKSTQAPLEFECPKGHRFELSYRSFRKGTRCFKCEGMELQYLMSTNRKKAYEYVKNRIESEPGYELLSNEYLGKESKLEIQCIAGHKFSMEYNSFRSGRRCQECHIYRNQSLMIEYIREIFPNEIVELEYTGYKFRFDDTKALMKFDVAIPSLNLVFEYQGEQHYISMEHLDGEEGLQKRIEKDNFKKKVCKEKGITLIEIPYTWNQTIDYVMDEIEACGIPIQRQYIQSRLSKYQ